ncbi:MAG: GNAT family N-acetyltransferase [Alphaproteobacteria bacterium]|nr:GNAT family N-acetyltransferase [Alphaproteobacteria bacterium]
MTVSLRPVTADDARLLFTWQSDPKLRRHFHNPEAPDWDAHVLWLKRRLGNPNTLFHMVMEGETKVGTLRLDRQSPGVFTVSIMIAPERQGQGLGKAALNLGRALRPAARLRAEVLAGNDASHAAFKAAGYARVEDGLYVHAAYGETPLAVFRVNAGPHVGLGHAQRCLALAEALRARGWDMLFLDAPGTGIGTLAKAEGFSAHSIADGEEAVAEAAEGARTLIVDHYQLDLKPLAEHAGRTWLLGAFDDAGSRPLPVDIAINGSPAADSIDYAALGAKLPLAGTAYQIIRTDLHPRPRRDPKQSPKQLLVTIGGGDPLEISETLLALLEKNICPAYTGLRVDYVTGPLAPAARTPRHDAIACHHAPSHMPDLLAGADIAISAAGQTLMELLYCAVPTVAFSLAENQRVNLAALTEAEGILSAGQAKTGEWRKRLETAIRRLLDDTDLRQRLAQKGKTLIDGEGAARIADAINGLANHDAASARQETRS